MIIAAVVGGNLVGRRGIVQPYERAGGAPHQFVKLVAVVKPIDAFQESSTRLDPQIWQLGKVELAVVCACSEYTVARLFIKVIFRSIDGCVHSVGGAGGPTGNNVN